jgi:sulfonate transport system substrate-binding protein
VARRWSLDNPQAYARALSAEIGIGEAIALLAVQTEQAAAVPIDDGVVADEQRTADLYLAARVIPERLDAARAFVRSFNNVVTG